jgi:hypothetical protein
MGASERMTADDALPVGTVTAILPRGAREAGDAGRLALVPGLLDATLVIEGQPVAELQTGTCLAVGAGVRLELLPADDPVEAGVAERPGDRPRGARVLAGGPVALGDRVTIENVALDPHDWLDLHPFRPAEVEAVVREYLEMARARGLHEVRIVHGRGHGVQRALVRRVLGASPLVAAFADAPPPRGGWGATVVRLAARGGPSDP